MHASTTRCLGVHLRALSPPSNGNDRVRLLASPFSSSSPAHPAAVLLLRLISYAPVVFVFYCVRSYCDCAVSPCYSGSFVISFCRQQTSLRKAVRPQLISRKVCGKVCRRSAKLTDVCTFPRELEKGWKTADGRRVLPMCRRCNRFLFELRSKSFLNHEDCV